ncbi:MAG: hypothetical protein J7647_08100 [Cyanobacteria bacterium SBLK]|nr:hypothetical protein [Cyanobacteria bacterium SBLK]
MVVDTQYIKDSIGSGGSKDDPLKVDSNSLYALVGNKYIVSGQGTTDLEIKANPGDITKFTAITTSANSVDSVILYGMQYQSGDRVFGDFVTNVKELDGAASPTAGGDGLPVTQIPKNFATIDSTIQEAGTENFETQIALYTLNDDHISQGPESYGYYVVDSSITIDAIAPALNWVCDLTRTPLCVTTLPPGFCVTHKNINPHKFAGLEISNFNPDKSANITLSGSVDDSFDIEADSIKYLDDMVQEHTVCNEAGEEHPLVLVQFPQKVTSN